MAGGATEVTKPEPKLDAFFCVEITADLAFAEEVIDEDEAKTLPSR